MKMFLLINIFGDKYIDSSMLNRVFNTIKIDKLKAVHYKLNREGFILQNWNINLSELSNYYSKL